MNIGSKTLSGHVNHYNLRHPVYIFFFHSTPCYLAERQFPRQNIRKICQFVKIKIEIYLKLNTIYYTT